MPIYVALKNDVLTGDSTTKDKQNSGGTYCTLVGTFSCGSIG